MSHLVYLRSGRPSGFGEVMTAEDAMRNDRISAGLDPGGSGVWGDLTSFFKKDVTGSAQEYLKSQQANSAARVAEAKAKQANVLARLQNRSAQSKTNTLIIIGVMGIAAVALTAVLIKKGGRK